MGTYTTNYQLYMPTVGEQGWGELMNGNLTTIDATMKGLDTRITAIENEVNGNLSCTSVTTSGTITSTGKITGNGGIETTSLTTSSLTISNTITSTGLITANGGVKGTYADVDCVKVSYNLATSKEDYGVEVISFGNLSQSITNSQTITLFEFTMPDLSNYRVGFGTKLGTLKNNLTFDLVINMNSTNAGNRHSLSLNGTQIYYYKGSVATCTYSFSPESNTTYTLMYSFTTSYTGHTCAITIPKYTIYANPYN